MLDYGAAVKILKSVCSTVLITVCTSVTVRMAVMVVDRVAIAVTVTVAGALGLVIKQLHAELMRGARTVARKVGTAPS